MILQARPTTYKGIKMRSRLEAEYAENFDRAGQLWEYEPRCFADETRQYLPDFLWLPDSGTTTYLEVKGTVGEGELSSILRRMEIIWSSEPDACLMVDISNPRLTYGVKAKGYAWKCLRRGDEWLL